MEQATGYTKQPLQLIFCIGSSPLYSHLFLKYAVTNVTNYNILVDQQAHYLFGFGPNNWTEEVWIWPRWPTSDGRKEFISITFVATAMSMSRKTLFDCGALASDLPFGIVLLEDTLTFMFL